MWVVFWVQLGDLTKFELKYNGFSYVLHQYIYFGDGGTVGVN